MTNPDQAPAAAVSRQAAAGQVSPKVNFAALGAAKFTTLFWGIAAATWWNTHSRLPRWRP